MGGAGGDQYESSLTERDRARPFGDLLRRLRQAAGLSQEELAERSGVSPRNISNLERGAPHVPRRDTVDLLADALGLAADDRGAFLAAARRLRSAGPSPSSESSPVASPRLVPRLPARIIPPTPLLGRERALAGVLGLARSPEVRLLTLTGPAGVGKTRLALEAAARLADAFADGIAFIPLAPIVDPGLVLPTVARTLGARQDDGLSPEALAAWIGERELLLVLDNLEQVLAAATAIAELLVACPRLTLMATSRAPLRVRGEREWPVAPLALPLFDTPRDPDRLAGSPAVELFVTRARAVQPDFALDAANAAAVAEICVRLDGLPLAIELAAPLLRLLGPAALARRLAHPLPALVEGARDLPARQQSLRSAITWSYDLLRPADQALFRRLGVFVGGFTFDGVAAVSQATGEAGALAGLAALAEQSLVRKGEGSDGAPRFALLETIREFAAERLAASGEDAIARAKHGASFLALAEEAEARLRGPEQRAWLTRLEGEHDNLRAALSWFLESGDAESATRLAGALGWFWWTRGYLEEGQDWLERALAAGSTSDVFRAKALRLSAVIARERRDLEKSTTWNFEALALSRRHGDVSGIVAALFGLGGVALARLAFPEAEGHYREALDRAREAGLKLEVAGAMHNLAVTLLDQGRLAEAEPLHEEALARFRALGDLQGVSRVGTNLGDLARRAGNLPLARARLEEALSVARELGAAVGIALTLRALAEVLVAQGEHHHALDCCREGLALARGSGHAQSVADVLDVAARAVRLQGCPTLAARILGAAEAMTDRFGLTRVPSAQRDVDADLAALRALMGDEQLAAERAAGRALSPEEAMALCEQI